MGPLTGTAAVTASLGEQLTFWVLAAWVVGGALFTMTRRNPVTAVMSLVGTFFALAATYASLSAHFLAVLQILVYAGAIMVLFIFVVMLLGVDKKEALIEPLRWQRPLAAGLGLLLAAEAIYLALSQHIHVGSGGLQAGPHEGNVQAVARVLFTDFLWPFEITAGLLVIAVVGSVVLARRSGQSVEMIEADTYDDMNRGKQSEAGAVSEPGVPASSERAET